MSKIGNINLALQEQANELGFSTTQEAFGNGYMAVYKDNGDAFLAPRIDGELEQAHREYENRRETVIAKLEMLIQDTPYRVYKDTLKEAIEFIKEKEV